MQVNYITLQRRDCVTLCTINYLEDTGFSVTNIILKERGLHPSFSVINIKHLLPL